MTASYNVTEESLDSIAASWADTRESLRWYPPFVLPNWLKVWWQAFGSATELYIRAVRRGADIIGIAPLAIKGNSVSFIGSPDVCDYLDFITVPGKEGDFFGVLLDHLAAQGIERLDLAPLRPDSTALTGLAPLARSRGCEIVSEDEDVTVELELPSSWEGYLATLSRKQRHEVRRKLRRLGETDGVEYRCLAPDRSEASRLTDTFLQLFRLSHEEKAGFMTTVMESFFRSLTDSMAEIGLLRFGIIEIDVVPRAMILGFDYDETMHLYNSAYDPDYGHLSIGVLSKILCLKDTIERGKKKWDFLKGAEPYKYHIGGQEVPLKHLQIVIR